MTFPPDFTLPYEKLRVAHLAAHRIAELAPGHRGVVQAGGCAGLWPIALSTYFAHVYTFEPEPMNFQCLEANIALHTSITAYPFALGNELKDVGLTRPKEKAGLWRINGDGSIPMVRLDDLVDSPIDALVLDVEGSELAAWQGAERLITEYRPLLWFEYLEHSAEINAFLAAHNYVPPIKVGLGGDGYSVHMSRTH